MSAVGRIRKKIRAVVVDDSFVARELLVQILQSDPDIEVVGQAKNGAEAVERVAALRPDIVTMDIHMPVLDGLDATEQIMAFAPTPILVVSTSVYGQGMGSAFEALDLGALDVVKKPEARDWTTLGEIGEAIIQKVKVLANVKVVTHVRGKRTVRPARLAKVGSMAKRSLVAIGSSTGGPSALLEVLGRLSADLPVPVVVAQHIADGFVSGLASWLDSGCAIKVTVAENGVVPEPGVAYLAPTGANLRFEGSAMRVVASSPGQVYVPNIDTLFDSVALMHGANTVGVLLTGMGADGAEGLKLMRNEGAYTIAQDEATSVVYGMPKAAVDIGAAMDVLPVHCVADAITKAVLG
ncbi:MAG: chemotaxis-specific protein-glutamate methyltransferase CheB [Coriobacteriia bacterium]|nr:chemotaxis-specific protein-glutamate methyltransferase CheB [Coriobacteriia bacterium]